MQGKFKEKNKKIYMNKYKFYKQLFKHALLSGDTDSAYYWKKLYEREELKHYLPVDNIDDED